MRNWLMNNKYFFKVWLFVSIAIFLVVYVLSFVLYRNFEQKTLDSIHSVNVEMMNETSRMNAFMARNIILTGMHLLYEPLIQNMLTQEDIRNFDVVLGIRRLDAIQSMGEHIHSVFIYNPNLSMVFASSNYDSTPMGRFKDQGLKELVQRRNVYGLFPTPRWMGEDSKKEPVYSFVFSNSNLYSNRPGAIVINVNLGWLVEIDSQSGENAEFIIYDQEYRVVYNNQLDRFLESASHLPYVQRLKEKQKVSGYFIDDVKGVKSLIVYSRPENQSWTFVRVMPYESIIFGLRQMRDSTVYMSGLILMLGLTGAYFLTRKIYDPIGRLVSNLTIRNIPEGKDELSHLADYFNNLKQNTQVLTSKNEAYLSELQQKLMREIVFGNLKNEQEIRNVLLEYQIPVSPKGDYYMVLCRHGRLAGSSGAKGYFDEEIFRDYIEDDSVHIFHKMSDQKFAQFIESMSMNGCNAFAVDKQIYSVYDFSKAYKQLLKGIQDQIFYPKGYVINIHEAKRLEKAAYPIDKEKAVIQKIRKGNLEEAQTEMLLFLKDIKRFSYEFFKFYLVRFLYSLQNLVSELDIKSYIQESQWMQRDYFENQLKEMESFNEVSFYFEQVLSILHQGMTTSKLEKYKEIANRVELILDQNYGDVGLSPAQIADDIGLSATYVNHIYKSCYEISISEALNQKRMEQACQLLQSSDLTIKEIAVKAGFDNDNYFYTLFKKQYGKTPGQYRKQLKQEL